jgi:hypothetical protein
MRISAREKGCKEVDMSMIALLKPVEHDPLTALTLACLEFVRREERQPEWVELGDGVELGKGQAAPLGLKRVKTGECRAGHLRVGVGEVDYKEANQ